MNAIILDNLKAKREFVEKSYNEMVRISTLANIPFESSKKAYFQFVFNYFENMSKVKTNKCIKSSNAFIAEFWKAIEAADNNARRFFKYEIRRENASKYAKYGW